VLIHACLYLETIGAICDLFEVHNTHDVIFVVLFFVLVVV